MQMSINGYWHQYRDWCCEDQELTCEAQATMASDIALDTTRTLFFLKDRLLLCEELQASPRGYILHEEIPYSDLGVRIKLSTINAISDDVPEESFVLCLILHGLACHLTLRTCDIQCIKWCRSIQLSQLGRVAARMKNRQLSRAWEQWQEVSGKLARQKCMLGRVAARMKNRQLSWAWEQWQEVSGPNEIGFFSFELEHLQPEASVGLTPQDPSAEGNARRKCCLCSQPTHPPPPPRCPGQPHSGRYDVLAHQTTAEEEKKSKLWQERNYA